MHKLSSLICVLFLWLGLAAQSPHGDRLIIDCGKCHTATGWSVTLHQIAFSHDSTKFSLKGIHANTDCRKCHSTLIFDEASSDCISCHLDPHQNSLGVDCNRCHGFNDWIVDDINSLHQKSGFPLLGTHAVIDCKACHVSETRLRFDRIGSECIDCHLSDFEKTSQPDHKKSGFSQDCAECHDPSANRWVSKNFMHDFFPLTGVHDLADCKACHLSPNYADANPDCFSCHQKDYDQSNDPNHSAAGFSTDCKKCHTLTPGWEPAKYSDHDPLYFPIYSGEHKGEWNKCSNCHLNGGNYSSFSCTVCHENPDTDEEHKSVSGYFYENNACLACHPQGNLTNVFDHDASGFPLTEAHKGLDCIKCHAGGFKGTPKECSACHLLDYQQSQNPSHQKLALSLDCIQCHTTTPDWKPARFEIHDQFYTLNGAHKLIENKCADCHGGNYTNTPNTCAGCHLDDYNNTLNPPHLQLQFSTNCTACHNENVWIPSTFDHDGQYFPVYSGKHKGQWMECRDCHTSQGNYKLASCVVCHLESETNQEHNSVNGYWYNDPACLACHPTGDANAIFDHNTTAFPLTGAHLQTDCKLCHTSGFKGTSSLCMDCHLKDYDAALNPDHNKLGLNKDCSICHTTSPDWQPARFDQHDQYYTINNAHKLLDCNACHNGNYINTPNTCAGCHLDDYNATLDPAHKVLQFSTNCTDCHNEIAWIPSTFDHDGQYFPIYSGKHKGQWMECRDCHINPSDIKVFSCTICHMEQETGDEHLSVPGYFYNDQACLACHPSGDKADMFDHNTTQFPLTGAHLQVNCKACHQSGFKGTPTDCALCHLNDFNSTTNPKHTDLGFSTDCIICHTTQANWKPARFEQHDLYYELKGAHKLIANDCALCHQGNYNQTPNTCEACHIKDYNNTKDPDHILAQFSTDCARCHSENTWVPSTFDHDGQHFPIYSGKHKGQWMDCKDCHNNGGNFKEFVCTSCHINPETDEKHLGVMGYFYNDQACFVCHPTGSKDDMFDHNNTNFPLTGAHLQVDCKSCHMSGFKGTPMECQICHEDDFNNANNPDHKALGFVNECALCHTTAPDWKPALLENHDDYYVLTGKHIDLKNDCFICHKGDYNNTPKTCEGCHMDDYNGTTNPNHIQLGFQTDCAQCHSTAPDWKPALMPDHDAYYPLTGAHLVIANDCIKCHSGNYNNTPNKCEDCHLSHYNTSTNPSHINLGLPTDCAMCHTTNPAWEPALMPNHDVYYPLTGAHAGISNDCAACHHGDYNNTPNNCDGCHLNNYNTASNPDHKKLGLSKNCDNCHTTNPGWEPAQFPDHNNYYPLNGAHLIIANDCAACHNGNYNNTPNTCEGCHLQDYNQTTNPDHAAQQFPKACDDCHTETAWIPSTFNHNNYYVFTGAHIAIKDECVLCHMGNYGNSPNTCKGCHLNDYNQTSNPNHGNLGFSVECQICHTTSPGWAPALMPNHDSYYPLLGAHLVIKNDCAACHNGNYNNTPNTCVGCHLDDYNQTNNPDHQNAQFPTNCELCHNVNAWIPSTFNHDGMYFPIYTGKHKDEWNTCSDCHTNPNNYNIFSCINCHEHNNKNEVDDDHNGVPGYSYNSNACYSCHPTGKK